MKSYKTHFYVWLALALFSVCWLPLETSHMPIAAELFFIFLPSFMAGMYRQKVEYGIMYTKSKIMGTVDLIPTNQEKGEENENASNSGRG